MISEEVFMDIIAMYRNGYSIRKIAKIKGIHRKTVKKYLKKILFLSTRKKRKGVRFSNPITRSLRTSWNKMTTGQPGSSNG